MTLKENFELNDVLRSLVPISNLSKDSIELLASSANVKSFNQDYIIFNEGDNDEYAYYLLEGELELLSTNSTNFHVVSGTDDSRYPLAQFQPRQYTAKAVVDSLVLVINRTFLDSLLVGNKADNESVGNGVEVNDIESDEANDWMSRILQSPLYINISVENIQKIFSKIESIDVKKGDQIINQGDSGDYYFIIQKGRCCVSRKPTPTSQDIKLTELREGDAFGEESIIANLKRNASVTMLTDGRLMRLGKIDFKELILEPILEEVNFDDAQSLVNEGAVWLDVRYPDEYQDYAIEGSLNIPLNVLRLQVEKLNKSNQYIVCCDTASRSSIAAYILAQNGYDVLHLEKGLKDLLRDEDIEPVETTNVVPFKNSTTNHDDHVLSSTFHGEMKQLRKELDSIRKQFKEINNVKEITTELKQAVITDTEKKLKVQRERINLQTQNANKLIQQAQELHKELKKEKRLIHEVVDKSREEQEKTMLNIQQSINKRLMEEEKKMQEFYKWKDAEIKKIRELKKEAEKEYISKKLENELNKKDSVKQTSSPVETQSESVNSKETETNNDLQEWLKRQVENELTPINREVQKAKRRLIEQANERAVKSKQIKKIHDLSLTSEIDALLKGG